MLQGIQSKTSGILSGAIPQSQSRKAMSHFMDYHRENQYRDLEDKLGCGVHVLYEIRMRTNLRIKILQKLLKYDTLIECRLAENCFDVKI